MGGALAAQFALAAEIAADVTRAAEPALVVEALAARGKWLLSFDRCTLAVGGRAWSAPAGGRVEAVPPLAPDGPAAFVARTRQALVLAAGVPRPQGVVVPSGAKGEHPWAWPEGSAIVVPLLARRGLVGVLGFASRAPGTLGRGDLGLANILGLQAAVALDNAHLVDEVRRLAGATAAGGSRRAFVAELVATAGRVLNAETVLLGPPSTTWAVVAGEPPPAAVLGELREALRATPGRPVGEPLALAWPEPGASAALARLGEDRGVLVGVATHGWEARESSLLGAYAGHCAIALRAADLAEAAAAEATRTRAIVDSIGDGLAVTDARGIVERWNPGAERITGLPASAARGRPWTTVATPVADGAAAGGDRVVVTPDGVERRITVVSSALGGDGGDGGNSGDGEIHAFRDVTAERLVDRMKTDFVATVSHELRTPLAQVHGYAATLLRPDVTWTAAQIRTFSGEIARESVELSRIVEDLLSVNGIEAGTLRLRPVPVDVAALAADATARRLEFAPPGGPDVHVDASTAVWGLADPERLRQVITNLVDNALKYAAGADAPIVVSVAADPATGEATVAVRDAGPGISPVDLPHVFDKFFRVDAMMARGVGGTGLGLYLSRRLMDGMGGGLWAESVEGRGSMFAAVVPLAPPR